MNSGIKLTEDIFTKDIGIIKKNQTEILELKNSVKEMENSTEYWSQSKPDGRKNK